MGRAGLGLIALAALALRVWGIGSGLPELFHPDEPAYVLQALAVGRGLPDGLTFANPPLFKYLLLVEYAGAYGLERLIGVTRSAAEFVEQFRANPTLLYLMARLTSAAFGAATAVAAAALGCAVGGMRTGLIAGGLSAVAYLLVREAHFGVNDTLVTLLVTVGLIACVRVLRRGCTRDYVIAGVLSGLAFAAKYDGIALLAPLLVAHLARVWGFRAVCPETAARSDVAGSPGQRQSARQKLGLALAACIAAAIVAFPSLLTEPGRVLNDVYLHLYLEARSGYDGLDPSGGYLFYARTLGIAVGWPLLAASAAGIAVGLARRNWAALVVTALPVAMLTVLGSQRLYFARFALPALPALLVLAALALDALFSRQVIIGAIALLVAGMPTAVDSVRFDALSLQTDTRTLARAWMAAALPSDVDFAADEPPLGPFLPPERNVARNDAALFDHSIDEYRALGAQYLVVSSFTAEARAVEPAREAQRLAFNAALGSQAVPLAQFRPYSGDDEPPFEYDAIYGPYNDLDRLERPGPTITVYRLTR